MEEAVNLFLAAIQSKLEPDAYATINAFSAWIDQQCRTALASRDPELPALLAFPELIGLPLYFYCNRQTSAQTVQEAALEFGREHWLLALRHLRSSVSSLLLPRALLVHSAMQQAFAKAACDHNAYIVAGSSFLPFVDNEAALGLHLVNKQVQNVSYLFAPSGKLLSRTGKINLTKGLESWLGLSKSRLEDWTPTQTRIGNIGTLICYDAFFDACIAKADSSGTQILVQPSANAAKWQGAWSADPKQLEGQEWMARGATTRIQGSQNIQVVLNPMLVGKLFDLEFEGCSSIGFNGKESVVASSFADFSVVSAEHSPLYS
jgi:predicted amidohydrolase